MATDILIVDDEADIRELVSGILEDEGHGTRTAHGRRRGARRDREAAAAPRLPRHLAAGQPARRPAAARRRSSESHPDLPVVMISGHGNIETAVAAIKQRRLRLHREAVQGRPARPRRRARARGLAAAARGQELKAALRRSPAASSAAPRRRTICGTTIEPHRADQQPRPDHRRRRAPARSSRPARCTQRPPAPSGPFVVINAATITPERMEEELFGVEAADGTARARSARSRRRMAARSIIDEVADMPRETQNKILRVLVDQSFTARRRPDAGACRRPHRLLDRAATSRRRSPSGASARTSSTAWRWCRSRVPALAERREDIPELIDHFMRADLQVRAGCPAGDRRRRHGGAAGARLAGQRPPAAQQRRAADDPYRRRCRRP